MADHVHEGLGIGVEAARDIVEGLAELRLNVRPVETESHVCRHLQHDVVALALDVHAAARQFPAQLGLLTIHVVSDARTGQRPDAGADQSVLAPLFATIGVGQVAERSAAQSAGDGARAGVVADCLSGVGVDRGAGGQRPGADDTCRKGGPVAHR